MCAHEIAVLNLHNPCTRVLYFCAFSWRAGYTCFNVKKSPCPQLPACPEAVPREQAGLLRTRTREVVSPSFLHKSWSQSSGIDEKQRAGREGAGRGGQRPLMRPPYARVQARGKKISKKYFRVWLPTCAHPRHSETRPGPARGARGQFEKFLPVRLYCVIPTKRRQKDKSPLPAFIYN